MSFKVQPGDVIISRKFLHGHRGAKGKFIEITPVPDNRDDAARALAMFLVTNVRKDDRGADSYPWFKGQLVSAIRLADDGSIRSPQECIRFYLPLTPYEETKVLVIGRKGLQADKTYGKLVVFLKQKYWG